MKADKIKLALEKLKEAKVKKVSSMTEDETLYKIQYIVHQPKEAFRGEGKKTLNSSQAQ